MWYVRRANRTLCAGLSSLSAMLSAAPRRPACVRCLLQSLLAPPRTTAAASQPTRLRAAREFHGPVSAVRAVPLLLLTVSKGGGAHFDGACAEYAGRLQHYTAFKEVVSKPNPRNASDPEAQKLAEGERLLLSCCPRRQQSSWRRSRPFVPPSWQPARPSPTGPSWWSGQTHGE